MKINKRIILFVLLLVISANVFAIIPLIVLAPVAESVLESFVVRSVANEILATIGTAANDGSWISTFSAWLRAGNVVGRVAIGSAAFGGGTIDVEINHSDQSNAPVGLMNYGFVDTPSIPNYASADGSNHTGTLIQNVNLDAGFASYVLYWNSLASGGYQMTATDPCTNFSGQYECYFSYASADANAASNGAIAGYMAPVESTDGVKRIFRSGGAFYADANDPDWLASDAAKINGQSDVRFWNANNSAFLDVSASSSGKTVIDYQEQVDPQTVRELTTQLDASSIPTSSSTQTQTGTLADTPVTADPGTSTTPSLNIPTDYNRETTQGKVETDLSTAPTVDPVLATEKATLSTNSDAQKQLITDLGNKGQDNESGLLDWSLPQPVAQEFCVDPVVNIFQNTSMARTITFSGFCDSFMKVRALFDWLLYIFTLIYLFRIATSSSNSEA